MRERDGAPRVGLVHWGTDLRSGSPRCLLQLACGTDPARFATVPYCAGQGELADAFAACGTPAVVIRRDPMVGGRPAPEHASLARRALSRARYAALLARSFKSEQLDLVHLNTLPLTSAAAAARARSLPIVWHIHEEASFFEGARAIRLFPLRHLSSRVVTVSDFVAHELARRRVPTEMIRVVHNGVDTPGLRARADPERQRRLRRELGLDDATPVVGMAGKLTSFKGADLFVEMAARVGPRAQYLVAGDSDHPRDTEFKAALRRRAGQLTGSVRLVFAGHRPELPDLMALMDVFVAPSQGDPFPLVVLEAMAMGRAIVATRSGGQAEMLEQERSGLLVPPGDVDALSRAVTRLLDSEAQRQRLGDAALERVQRDFSVERYVDGVARVWDEVLRERAAMRQAGR